jgi:hypothetical protein
LLGGTITAGTHFTKAGSRAALNTSPEPVTNWTASFAEDVMVMGGMWLALFHPIVFIVLLVIFLAFAAWLLPKLWRFAKRMISALAPRSGAAGPG